MAKINEKPAALKKAGGRQSFNTMAGPSMSGNRVWKKS